MNDFDNTYRGYVIAEKQRDAMGYMFVGKSSEQFRVALREHAARFTKTEAIEYIKNGTFCKDGEFMIEDAK